MTEVIMRRVRKGNQSPSQYCPNCEAQAAEIEKLRDALVDAECGLRYATNKMSGVDWIAFKGLVDKCRKALEQST